MGTLVVVGSVLAGIPDSLDGDRLEVVLLLLLLACAISAVLVLRTVHKATVRLLVLAVLFVVAVGLWTQRQELDACRGQCICRVFGQDVDMGDVPGRDCPS